MSKYLRRISPIVRRAAGCPGSPWRIEVVSGNSAPRIEGSSFHWTTRTGRPILYPSAYARKGRRSMVYHPSTRRIIVGASWLSKRDGI